MNLKHEKAAQTHWMDRIGEKPGVRLLVLGGLVLFLTTGYVIYITQWLSGEIHSFYTVIRSDSGPGSVKTVVEQVTTHFISITFIFLALIIGIVAAFSIHRKANGVKDRHGRGLENQSDDPLIEENDLLSDDIEDELETDLGAVPLSESPTSDHSERSGILTHSYSKMVDALKRINELEKEHSIELADANRQLQREISERKRAEQEIRHLSNRLISGIEEGRKNLAQDLHDEFGQTLTALHLGAETLMSLMPDTMDAERYQIMDWIKLIEQLGDKIRNISSDLRPDLLDDLGLVPTLNWYITEFNAQRSDIQITFQAIGFRKRLASELELVLYRVFQEGINNVVKHASAHQVNVTLTYSHPKVIFILKDDGVGFEQDVGTDGIGLLGMRERVVSVNGSIAILSGREKGTTIRVELPVSRAIRGLNGEDSSIDR